MDRLARNLEDLRRIVRELTGKGIRVEFVRENLTFAGDDSPMNTLLLSMLGAVAEFERSMILERQREETALAKAAGKYKGCLYQNRPTSSLLRRVSVSRFCDTFLRHHSRAGEAAPGIAQPTVSATAH
jgi:DNA invertase Pin-like site-specific DNA recombinase